MFSHYFFDLWASKDAVYITRVLGRWTLCTSGLNKGSTIEFHAWSNWALQNLEAQDQRTLYNIVPSHRLNWLVQFCSILSFEHDVEIQIYSFGAFFSSILWAFKAGSGKWVLHTSRPSFATNSFDGNVRSVCRLGLVQRGRPSRG